MAEKKIPITYRAMGEEGDKKKRISLSPNDSVQQIEEKCKELFKLQGRVCLKAKIGTDEFIIEANSQEDIDVLHDAEELIIQPNENDQLVRIDEEVFDLDKLPLYTSTLVRRERQKLAIPSMVPEFKKVKDFLTVAFYGTRKFIEINKKVEQAVFMFEKLCDSSLQSMESFHSKCGLILEKLQGAIRYLSDGQHEMAALNFKAIADISTKMIAKSSELQEQFEEGIKKVRDAIDSTLTERSKQEKMFEDEKERMKKTEMESKVKEKEVAQFQEKIETLKCEAHETKHEVSVEEVWKLQEDKNDMISRKKDKQAQLSKSDKELESLEESCSRLVQIMGALHWAISGLKGLSIITLKTKQIFGRLSNEVDSFASQSDALKVKVDFASDKHGGFLHNLCKTRAFKVEAVTCRSQWVALKQELSSHKIQMKKTTDDVQTFLCENPTQEEAYKKVTETTKKFEQQLQLARALEDDQQEESSPASVAKQVDPEDNQEDLPPCVLSEDAPADIEGGTRPATNLPDVDPEEGSQSTGPHQAAKEVIEGEGAPPYGRPMTYSNAVKQGPVRGEKDIKDTQQGGVGRLWKTTEIWEKGGMSQGFGFVCYNTPEEAVQAIKHMDGETIKNKSVIVDLAENKEGRNVYINNLADNIDDQYLRHIFEEFGTITSAKVMMDPYRHGYSKGYGFVCFRTSDQAAAAIKKMDGKIIEDRQLYVDLHVPPWKDGRNIYVSNLADNIDEDSLYQAFEPFGTITSAKVMVDLKDGSSKGFGFVCFSSPQEALLAIDEMNGKIIEGKQLYAVAQPRAGRNVYVNNLARHIDDDQLHEAFARFGTITSAKVKTDPEGNSLGFGFVCYRSPQEAEAAINKMNGSTLESMVLNVALAQPPQRREYPR